MDRAQHLFLARAMKPVTEEIDYVEYRTTVDALRTLQRTVAEMEKRITDLECQSPRAA